MGKFAIILIAGLTLIFSAFSIQLNSNKSLATKNLIEMNALTKAKNIANSFTLVAIKKLEQDSSTDDFSANNVFSGSEDVNVDFQKWNEEEGKDLSFGEIRIITTVNYDSNDDSRVFSNTVLSGIKTYNDYLIFTDKMGGYAPGYGPYNTSFIGDQIINGKFHTNGNLRIVWKEKGSPTFTGDVSWSENIDFSGFYNDNQLEYNPGLYQGFGGKSEKVDSLGSPTQTFYDPTDPINVAIGHYDFTGSNESLFSGFNSNDKLVRSYDRIESPIHGRDYAENSFYDANSTKYISLEGDKIYVSPVPSSFPKRYDYLRTEIDVKDIEDAGGVFYTDGDIHIEGSLDGDISIATDGNVYIDNDITYDGFDFDAEADGDPDTDPLAECDDYLGLMAKGEIVVNTAYNYKLAGKRWKPHDYGNHRYINQVTSYDDRTQICASIYTQNGLVAPGLFSWNLQDHGDIDLYGSYSAENYGATGLGRGDGFSKNFYYDKRLYNNPTAGVPYLKDQLGNLQRKITMWDESNNL